MASLIKESNLINFTRPDVPYSLFPIPYLDRLILKLVPYSVFHHNEVHIINFLPFLSYDFTAPCYLLPATCYLLPAPCYLLPKTKKNVP
ncbi:MAG: hypothetical protein F6J90_16540 [Moorea sp. SIOASIH]|uniref:hypothetical protein n=1 Tax=Moorena sp. SIOASIH TaxID=2607817 RepID=UPI0013BDCD43|nr:hypothetical protein [Moorena sp. SIOASIH]NEO37846.1 hypothetical protein [Moorena sp. SIOASIH]